MGFIPENVIVNLKKEIAASGGAAIEALTTRVQTLESTVGDETGGLVKDVDDLETVVGDSTSGLVKDVDDLETVVGNSSSGLVKDNISEDITATFFGTLPEGVTIDSETCVYKKGDLVYGNVILHTATPILYTGIEIPITLTPAHASNSFCVLKTGQWTSHTMVLGYLYLSTTGFIRIHNSETTETCTFCNFTLVFKVSNSAQQTREEDPENNDDLK